MARAAKTMIALVALLLCGAVSVAAQSTTGTISGNVQDEKGAAIPGATVTVRNVATNVTNTSQTGDQGYYRFQNLPVGGYEVTVEAAGFAKHVQTGITLSLNQDAVIDVSMKPGGVQEVVTVTENAALLNTTTAEVSTRFDSRRVSELPLAPNRNVFNVALGAAGVSQLGSGQTGFANGISFSSNGGRLRSNNFMIDGQDINDPSVSGGQQAINNPDLVQEVRLITNQFLPEYGRNAGSVLIINTKPGGNEFHGTAFWFYNGNALNACNNLNKTSSPVRFCAEENTPTSTTKRPFRIENQIGFTIGGPLHLPSFGEGGPRYISGRDRTFFFGSYQRWSDRQLGSGFKLIGAPTAEGRAALQAGAGNRPQVQALLRFLPAATDSSGPVRSFVVNGQTFTVPTGSITGSASSFIDDHQASWRVDHTFNDANRLTGRYLYDDFDTGGTGQVTPPGLTTKNVFRSQAVNITLNSVLRSNLVNEVRTAFSRLATTTASDDPDSETIPSIEISDLGLAGFNAANNRTAIGLAVNLPQFRNNNTYQVQDNLAWTKDTHNFKFGVDIRRTQVKSFFVPTIRGRLAYTTLQSFVDDIASTAALVNRPLLGGQEIQYYYYYDSYYYAQDEWKVRPNFTLTYGLRYELPGNNFDDLVPVNDAIVAANGNDERYRFTPVPGRDTNNFQPRVGFNYNPRTREDGILGFLTGGDKLVFRGGYARTHDSNFININLNIASAFPFVAAINLSPNGAFTAIPSAQPVGLNPATFARTIVSGDFRAPVYDQLSFEVQRELTNDLVLRVGYVGTRGRDLFQTIDGNPRQATNNIFVGDPRFSQLPNSDPAVGALLAAARAPGSPNNPCRVTTVDPANCTLGVIRLRANGAESDYHSMQVSLDKRLSRGISAGLHFTWSSFIDTASELFNPSGGEVAVSQNSFDREADRARSTYDRPLRLSGNFVYELPFYRDQQGFVGRVLGGWQLNSFFTFQSGAPFTPLNGSDPTGALNGISGLVGDAVRANVIAPLPTTSAEDLFNLIRGQGQQFFAPLTCTGPAAPDSTAASPRFLPSATCQRFGNAGRNILRADGINNVDLGIIKNTRIGENTRLQLRADMFNATNTRDFGIPTASVTAGAFLNQWTTNGGNRRIIVGARLVF